MLTSGRFTKSKCVCFYYVVSLKRKTLNWIKHITDINKYFAQASSIPRICESLDHVVLFIG